MRPVFQTDFTPVTGNCFQACIASILEMELEDIPAFMKDGDERFHENWKEWTDSTDVNFQMIDMRFEPPEAAIDLLKDCYVMAVFNSPRHNADHAVVWKNGKVVHDPYPEGEPVKGDPKLFTVFIPKRPEVLK